MQLCGALAVFQAEQGPRDNNPDHRDLTNKSWVTSSEQDHQEKSCDRVT
jgi:hypothetical protein